MRGRRPTYGSSLPVAPPPEFEGKVSLPPEPEGKEEASPPIELDRREFICGAVLAGSVLAIGWTAFRAADDAGWSDGAAWSDGTTWSDGRGWTS